MHDKLIIIKNIYIFKKKNRKVQKPGGCESKTMTAIRMNDDPMSKKSETEKEKTKQQKWR